MKKSAFISTKQPRQWQWMDYQGSTQSWNTEDLGYGSVFPAITGKIFEFGFADAIQQMWAAFVDELAGGTANGFPCANPAEAAAHHAVLTAALQSGSRKPRRHRRLRLRGAMKRSEINQALRFAIDMLRNLAMVAAVWGNWTSADFAANPDVAHYLRSRQLGWDVTDFGSDSLCRTRSRALLPAQRHSRSGR